MHCGFYGNGVDFAEERVDKCVIFALKLCASLGGDTDTVGALVGALCAAYAGSHNIPQNILDTVVANNHLDLEQVAQDIKATFWK